MLARFERLIEQAVEGSLRRVFPASLQPIQLDKAAARAMEQAQVIGRRGWDVPNLYELRIAPSDFSRFGDYRQTLGEDVRRYLVDYAHERGLRPVGDLSVQLIEDPKVHAGSVSARARFVGLPAPVQQELAAAVEGTRQLRLAELAGSVAADSMPLMLRDTSGLQFALEPSLEVVRLGRGVDNDVVLASSHVSRYHAQLRWIESSWLAYDLDSTNGTWVDDDKLLAGHGRAVRAGTRLRVGDHELDVRAVKAAARGRR